MNLREIIRQVLDETDLTEPTAVAEMAFARITKGEYADALRQMLRQFARLIMSEQRNEMPRPNVQSWKRDGIRAHAAEFSLNSRWHVDGEYKLLRDMTRDDVLYAIKEREDIAAKNIATAQWLRSLLDQLGPGQTVGDVFGGE